MALKNKILFLILFMFVTSLIAVFWFVSLLSHHTATFKQTMKDDWQQLEIKQKESMDDLNEKRSKLAQDSMSFMKNMEEQLRENQRKAEIFNQEFLEGQNDVFDKVDHFNSRVKP